MRGLTHLGEAKWRYRVVDEGETPRGAALTILTQASDCVEAHLAHRRKSNEMMADKSKDDALEREWAAELSEIWMGLALTRLIFNGEKRAEDAIIKKLLKQALDIRKKAGLWGPLAETHNALGSLLQKQHKHREAEVQNRCVPCPFVLQITSARTMSTICLQSHLYGLPLSRRDPRCSTRHRTS